MDRRTIGFTFRHISEIKTKIAQADYAQYRQSLQTLSEEITSGGHFVSVLAGAVA